MKRITLISVFCLIFGLLVIFFVTMKNTFLTDNIDCRSVVKFHKDGQILSLSVNPKFFSGSGVITLSGVLYDADKPLGYISKTVSFHYVKKGDIYQLKSEMILNSPQSTMTEQQQMRWLPVFFSQSGKILNIEVNRQGVSGWIISAEAVPLYLCEKSD